MTEGPDRDKAVARRGGLGRALGEKLDTSGKECPEASVLAAYFDRELTSEEAARWELHFSACARCQGQLAALARAEPPAERPPGKAPAAVPRFWDLRWIAPLATAAAAAALWIALRPTLPSLEKPPAQPESPARPESRVAVPSRAPSGPPAAQISEAPAKRAGGRGEKKLGASREMKAKEAITFSATQVPPPPEPALKVQAVPPGPGPAVQPAVPASSRRMVLAERREQLRAVAPGGQVMWRFGPGGSVEHSRDAGKTWKGQFLQETATWFAGSAPSENVCWVAGTAGTVLRTTDGERWEKVSQPAQADLVAIEARDAQHATVTAADGKIYRTEDGGRAWAVQ